MEYTKPLFLRMRNVSDETIEAIINAMWPDNPTSEDEDDIIVVRAKAKKFFQTYRCYLNNDLLNYADIIIERYVKKR